MDGFCQPVDQLGQCGVSVNSGTRLAMDLFTDVLRDPPVSAGATTIIEQEAK
jgi:hypothetical protein